MITTGDVKQAAKVEPKKLNHITTAIVSDAAPRPAPKGDGFAKMINTHDEPNPTAQEDPRQKRSRAKKG